MRFATLALVALFLAAAPKSAGPNVKSGAGDAARLAAGKKLLAKAIDAAGGSKALASIHSVIRRGTITAAVGDAEIAGTVSMMESRDGTTRDEMSFMGLDVVSAVGPAGGFTSQAGIPKPLEGAELVDAQAQSRFTPLGLLLHGDEPGLVLKALDPEEGLDVLELDPPDASPLTFYLDPKTHLVAKAKLTSKEGVTAIMNCSLYRPEAGVQMSHQMSIDQGGSTMTFAFDQVLVNASLPPEAGPIVPGVSPPAAATPAAGAAESKQELTVANQTGKILTNLLLSEHGKKNWGPDLLSVDRFHDGDTAKLSFLRGPCAMDMMVTDADGHFWVLAGLDVCATPSVTLKSDKSGVTFSP